MKKFKTIFVIIVLLKFAIVTATTYYVSQSSGNDKNSGTSSTKAWKSLSKISDKKFNPGDSILLKNGDTWTGENMEISDYSGTASNPIVFSSYSKDSKDLPVITTIVKHSLTWTSKGNGLWKAKNPPKYHPDRLFVDGKELLRANKTSEFDGKNFMWLYDAEENGNLYLYSKNDPSSKQITYTDGHVNIYLNNASYFIFENIELQGSWTSVFIDGKVDNITFNKMAIGKFAANGITANSDNTITPQNIHIENCTFDNGFTLDYSMAGTYRGSDFRGSSDAIYLQCAQNFEIDNNYFKNWGHASINIDGNPKGGKILKVSKIIVHDNYTTAPDICYGGRMAIDDAYDCEIYNNKIINTTVQCQFNGHDNHVHHNIIYGTKNTPIVENSDEIEAGISMESYSNGDVYNNIIENNIIANTEGAGFRLTNCGGHDIHDNTIRNNIIYNCGIVDEENGIGIRVQKNTSDCKIYKNTFVNNLVYNKSTTKTVDFRGLITDIQGFNKLNGTSDYIMTKNIAENPLFADPNNLDYHLQKKSPCIDAGTATLSKKDFDGNTIPQNSKYDIGAYEYNPNSTLISNNFISNINPIFHYNKINNFITITSNENSDLYIYNMKGISVRCNLIEKNTYDISNLANGIYQIRVVTPQKILLKKLIKFN